MSALESVRVPASYPLPPIPFTRLRCTLIARERAGLPVYKGSLLRGAFGHALRRAVCAMGPEQPCESYRLRRACIYTRIFETFVEGDLEPPAPLLRTAEILHVGKGATFGLGRIEIG